MFGPVDSWVACAGFPLAVENLGSPWIYAHGLRYT
jgi:hypothetical protein